MVCNVLLVHSQINILESYNGDFEDGLNHWRLFELPENNGSHATPVMDAASGNYALKINYVTDYGNIVDRGLDNWLEKVPVNEDITYKVKAFMKGDSNATGRLVKVKVLFGFLNAEQDIISRTERTYPLTDEYKEISFSKKAPAHAVSCWLGFRLFDATDPCATYRSMFIDNVQILRPYAVSVESRGPADSDIQLLTNFPNPFYKKTTIVYDVDETCSVTLRIFNIFGQHIETLVDQQKQNTGQYEVDWIPGGIPTGIYYYSLKKVSATGKESVFNHKMVLGR